MIQLQKMILRYFVNFVKDNPKDIISFLTGKYCKGRHKFPHSLYDNIRKIINSITEYYF
jgi:hypothetical protein